MPKRTPRAPMPPSRRAKQFAPFDALKGLQEAIAAKQKHPEPRRELSEYMKEQINRTLSNLQKGQQITVVYYDIHELETLQITGTVAKVDVYNRVLLVDQVPIAFPEIFGISRLETGIRE